MGKKTEQPAAAVSLHTTGKFSVLDAPGVSQPAGTAAAATVTSAVTTAPAASGGGLEGRRQKAGTGPKIDPSLRIGGDSFVQRSADSSWIAARNAKYDEIASSRATELAQLKPIPISVTLPDGTILTTTAESTPLLSYRATPYDIAVSISQGLADAAVAARVTYESFCPDYSMQDDGMEGDDNTLMLMNDTDEAAAQGGGGGDQTFLWDLTRPFVGPVAKLEFLKFEDEADAKTIFWHSSAHIMGEALEHLYGCKLTVGPPLAGGFYYDSYMGSDTFKDEDCTYELFVCACVNYHGAWNVFTSCRLTFTLVSFRFFHLKK
jgi:threonyl-tRNA synthetase